MQLKDNIKFKFNETYSTGNEECQNILIHGDNKDVLVELMPEYTNKIRCIYIDPPYNNGETYHYYDDNNTQCNWLKDMRRVLNLLKPLMSKDGSIWISIDDRILILSPDRCSFKSFRLLLPRYILYFRTDHCVLSHVFLSFISH